MQASDSIDKLMPAILKARKEIKPAGHSGKNTHDKYTYAKEEDWHGSIMPALLENDFLLTFGVTKVINLEDRKTKAGAVWHAVEVHGTVRLIHTSGQWIEQDCAGQGQDPGDKGLYKAMTGFKKYGYALLFALPTTDDVEKDPPAPPPKREWTEGQKVAWFRDKITDALKAKDIERLNKLGAKIQAKGFSKENEQTLLEKAAVALSSLQP